MVQLFDTHAHLQDRAFDSDRTAVLARARRAGIEQIVVIGESERSSRDAVELVATGEGLWAAVGVHPHNAKSAGAGFDRRLQVLASHPKVAAIGEIGLDFHYDRSPRDVQVSVFQRQLVVAVACDLPVVIHSRSALDETFRVLERWSAERRAAGTVLPFGVMHCFGYDVAAARSFLKLGFFVSIPGTVTFPRADAIREVARALPEDALVIETDAPVLAPQQHRGKRNEPAYLRETAEAVAALRGVSVERLGEITRQNARRLYRLPTGVDAASSMGSVPA
jgi:TatD DNase family protein